MKVIRIDELKGTERDVRFPCGMISVRPILERDGMGFSMHKTIIPAGEARHWHYTRHLEACYCVAGGGVLTNLATGERHLINADTVYALDSHDDHTFKSITDTVLISVFNPPVKGNEVHREDGSYE